MCIFRCKFSGWELILPLSDKNILKCEEKKKEPWCSVGPRKPHVAARVVAFEERKFNTALNDDFYGKK